MIDRKQAENMTTEFFTAVRDRLDVWVPAASGHETPTLQRDGRRLLYVFNPARGEHAHLDVDLDVIVD